MILLCTKQTDETWQLVTGTEITGLVAGLYEVRFAAKEGFNAGPTVEVSVGVGANQDQVAPTTLIGVVPTILGGSDGKITGATTDMEYRLLEEGTLWIAVTGTEITGLVTGFYDVRYAAKPGYNAGATVTVTVGVGVNQEQAAPTGLGSVAPTTFDALDGQITGTTPDMEYRLLSDETWTLVTGTKVTGLATGFYDVRYAAKPGYNAGTAATVTVGENQNQVAPTTLVAVAPSTFHGTDGQITGTTPDMEYRLLSVETWTPVIGTEITGLAAGSYDVRYVAKPGYNSGTAATIQIKEAEATLSALTIDGVPLAGFVDSTLIYDLELLAETTVVPTVLAAATDGNAPVVISPAASLPGTTTVLVTAEDGVTTKEYTINFKLANRVPLNLKGIAPTTVGGSDGKITGTTNEMEYQPLAGGTWTPVSGIEISNLPVGTYLVRYAAKPGYSVGSAASVIVPNFASGKLIFTFDDGWKDTITLGKTILDTAGFKATVYVNKDLTQISEYRWTQYHIDNVMDYDDLHVLYDHGWDISNHSANHLDFKRNELGQLVGLDNQPLQWQTPEEYGAAHPELDPEIWYTEWLNTLVSIGSDPNSVEDMRVVYLDNQNWLSNSQPDGLGKKIEGVWTPGSNLNMPLSAYHVAYPSGLYSDELIAMLKGIGVETGRATIETGIKNNITNPVTDFFNLPVQYVETELDMNGNDENLVDVLESIQYAVDNGTTVILMLHRVGPVGDLFVTPESLQAIVDYAKSFTDLGTLDVMTISQWYNMMK